MRKVQFASGPNLLEGWINLQENSGDITKPLPFRPDEVDFVFIEHGLEHVTPLQGFRFLKEAHRILKPGGVIRVIVPDVRQIWLHANEGDYCEFIDSQMDMWWAAANAGTPNHPCDDKTAFETILACHGHKAAYTEEVLYTFLEAAGFEVHFAKYGESQHEELKDCDSHWKLMGLDRCRMESTVAEGIKR